MIAEKSVFVKETAKVCGNIFAPAVSIIEGASFSGNIDMDGKKSGQSPGKHDSAPAGMPKTSEKCGVAMAWFKKYDDGDSDMMNANSSGRTGAQEPATGRAEPREPRIEPRNAVAAVIGTARPRAARRRRKCARRRARPALSCSVPTLRFRGELSAQEDLVIQGSVEGSITHTQSLTIGTDGTMKGDIRARVIVIDGKVDGDLYATESVSIRATAKVKGNVFAPRVAISDGAFFQGQVEMQPSGAAVQEHSARLRQAAMRGAGRSRRPRSIKMLSAS